MAQNGFAFFFVLVLAGCAFSLFKSIKANWQRIVKAIAGEAPNAQPMTYRAWQRRPIDVPEVAQRMALSSAWNQEQRLPEHTHPFPRYRPLDRRQLTFDLAV